MPIYVIYDHPSDFPPGFVVRKWLNDHPTEEALLFQTLRQARYFASACGARARFPRAHGDDPVILETWL